MVFEIMGRFSIFLSTSASVFQLPENFYRFLELPNDLDEMIVEVLAFTFPDLIILQIGETDNQEVSFCSMTPQKIECRKTNQNHQKNNNSADCLLVAYGITHSLEATCDHTLYSAINILLISNQIFD